MSVQQDSRQNEVDFINDRYSKNYRFWKNGTDQAFKLYENDNVESIEEITCWQLRITLINGRSFDFYPTSLKIFDLKFKKWHQGNPGELYNQLKQII